MKVFTVIVMIGLTLSRVSPAETERERFVAACKWPFQALGSAYRALTTRRERVAAPTIPRTPEEVAEAIARMDTVEAALDVAINEVKTPWRWGLKLRRNEMMRRSFEALERELSNQKVKFGELAPKERKEFAEGAVDTVIGPYRTRPSTLVIALGTVVPIGLAYSVLFLPEAARPAGYGVAALFGGPFAFGLTYWLNGKLKPLSGTKPRNTNVEKTPFDLQMERIGAASTGIPDPFKDGRNIHKDAQLQLRDSLNDAAFNIENEADAQRALAATALHHAAAFPEVKIDSVASYLLFLKLKKRFGNAEAMAKVQDYIGEIAKRESLGQPAEERAQKVLDRLLRPDLWEEGD